MGSGERKGALMMNIRPMTAADWNAVSRIYREGIETKLATFEADVPDWEVWDKKQLPIGRFVAEKDAHILGWAALSAYSSRHVYRGVAEVSVYVGADARGNGVGKILLNHLIEFSEENGFWTLQAGIFPHNEASIALHTKLGFRIVGKRERIGQLDGVWLDTVILERRSTKIGV